MTRGAKEEGHGGVTCSEYFDCNRSKLATTKGGSEILPSALQFNFLKYVRLCRYCAVSAS